MGVTVIERAAMLGMSGSVNFTDRTNVPLAVDTDMPKAMTFETSFVVTRMVSGKRSVNGFTMNGTRGSNFMPEFCTLNSKFDCRREGGGRHKW